MCTTCLMLLEVTMPRPRNGEASARDTLLVIQERKKIKNNAETSGQEKTPPSSPGSNKKKQPTPTKTKKTTPQTSPAAKEATSLASSAGTSIMCRILYRVFCLTTPITWLCTIPTLKGKHAQPGVPQDRSHATEEESPQARRAARRAQKKVIPQTQFEETTEGARKNDKPDFSISDILNEKNSDSDPESAKQILSDKDISGRDDTSDSNPESNKHPKSSTRDKPAQRQQLTSTKNVSGHDDAGHKTKTKLFKAIPKKHDNEPKFEDLYYLKDDSSKKRKSQPKKKKKNVRSAKQDLQEVAAVVTRMTRTLVVTRLVE